MEGPPDEFDKTEALGTKANIAIEVNEELARSEVEFSIRQLCDVMKQREENGYILLSSPESVYAVSDAVRRLEDAHEKNVIPFGQLEEYFSHILSAFESFLEKPESKYTNDDLESLREVAYRLKEVQDRIYDLFLRVGSKDESIDKEDSKNLRHILDSIHENVEQKRFKVERIADIYEKYLDRA